jgi:hypothetical protein
MPTQCMVGDLMLKRANPPALLERTILMLLLPSVGLLQQQSSGAAAK